MYCTNSHNFTQSPNLPLVQHRRGMVGYMAYISWSSFYQVSKGQSVHESRFYTDPCTPIRPAARAPTDILSLAYLTSSCSLYYVPIAVTTISLFRFPFPFPFPPFTVAPCIVSLIMMSWQLHFVVCNINSNLDNNYKFSCCQCHNESIILMY